MESGLFATLRRALAITALALTTLCWAAIAARILLYPENHVGFNVLWLLPIHGLTAISGVSTKMSRARWALVAIGIASLAGILCIYELNVLIPYEVWIRRGMPDRPF